MKKVIASTAVVGISLVLGGCQLLPRRSTATPSPVPTAHASPTPALLTLPTPASPSATIATPSAKPTVKSQPTTKGGVTTGKSTTTTTTSSVTTRATSYDTSFDTVEDSNFPGQSQEHTLTLYNKTNEKVLWSIRLDQTHSDDYPLSVNDSREATGSIDAQNNGSVKVKTYSSGKVPNFSTSFTINFVSPSGQQMGSRSIKVTIHTPANDNITTIDSDGGNASLDAQYTANKAYPIRLVNKHGVKVKFSAQIFPVEARNKFAISAASGEIDANNNWLTDVHFTSTDIGSTNPLTVNFEFRDAANNSLLSTKTLTVNVKR